MPEALKKLSGEGLKNVLKFCLVLGASRGKFHGEGGGLLSVTRRNGRRSTFKKESLSQGANTPGTKAKPEAQGCRFEPGAQKPDESS